MLRNQNNRNKQNIVHMSPVDSDIGSKNYGGYPQRQLEVAPMENVGLSIHEINSKVLEKQLMRISDSLQAERNDKNRLSSTITKIEEQLQVLKLQRDSYFLENQKLRIQLKNSYDKVRDVQQKSNAQINEFYQIKNQNNALIIEISQIRKALDQINGQKYQTAAIENQLRAQNQQFQLNINNFINEIQCKNIEIDSLRAKIWELQNEKSKIIEGEQFKAFEKEKEIKNLCNELNNFKFISEKKQQQFEHKNLILVQQNEQLSKTIEKLSQQQKIKQTNFGLQRTISLPTQADNSEYHIRLFVKENQIQKMAQKIRELESKIQMLVFQNGLLTQKLGGAGVSVKGYQMYAQMENQILKSSLKSGQWQNDHEIQSKQQEIEHLQEKLSQQMQKLQQSEIRNRKLQAEIQLKQIDHENLTNQINASRCQLERQIAQIKNKMEKLQIQCKDKDKVILGILKKDV